MTLVVILTVRPEALERFRAFETAAARVMERHGGALERAVVIPPSRPSGPMKEVHLVTFPTPEAFAAYRNDGELKALAHLREASVVSTEVLVGEEGPDYRALQR
jgi:uncharacterized protein (DUF1330 family)